jgi:hypothetical protein
MSHLLSYHASEIAATLYGERGWIDFHLKKTNFEKACRYCNLPVKQTFSNRSINVDWSGWDNNEVCGLRDFIVYTCPSCSWWQLYIHDNDDRLCGGGGDMWLHKAVLRKYDIQDIHAPTLELEKYILKNREKIYDIHPRKMEELVASVFKEYFNCDVEYCGGMYDKGIDLLIIQNDNPFPVQIRKRTQANSIESVSVVREMLGIMFRDQFKRGAVVSTASHFSEQALKEANEVVNKGLLEKFELIDVKRFIDMLELAKLKNDYPDWYSFIPRRVIKQFKNINIDWTIYS